jgi:serine phosphatase RsbU (regulator of sigma subunit)
LQVAGNLGTAIIYLLIAIFPFSIALAVLRYRLFDVDLVIRQTVIYASLSTLLISGYLGVTYALSQAAVGLAGPSAVTDGPAIAVIAALLMAIAASPIRRQLQDAVDRLVYHQRLVRRRFLADAVESLSQALPFGLLLRFMTVETPERLSLVGAWLAVPDSSILANQGDSNLPGPAAMLLARLGQTRRPSILSLEDVSSSAVASLPADDPLLSPWYRAGARLVVPLRASAVADSPDQVIGAWVLGGFRAGSLPDREDLEAFGRIGRQAAVLLDYARLSDEQVHQALVAQDLERARQIQARLLPTRVEGWPGHLEIAARLRPARETSGDFYDVFPLPGSVDASLNGVSPHPSLQIAVGDVAGKGLGAALVMALTQATLRTAGHDRAMSTRAVIPVGGRRASNSSDPVIDVPAPSPAETLAIASALLHRSVGPRDFVCCALAVVEEEFMPVQTGGEVRQIILRLANAGQIPPLLCRLGQVRELVPDGERLPLGVWPDLHYGELRLPLVPGDVVVFVTDGVPEAPAAAAQIGPVGAVGRNVALIPPRAPSEFFGFTRLASSAGHWATTATNAQGCLDGIWADAEAWSGARFDHDDMTLVVLRYSG